MPEQRLERVGLTGVVYQVVSESWWDSSMFGWGGKGGNLRVTVAVDDGGWSSFVPLTDDFIIAPDGSYIGENEVRITAAPGSRPRLGGPSGSGDTGTSARHLYQFVWVRSALDLRSLHGTPGTRDPCDSYQ